MALSREGISRVRSHAANISNSTTQLQTTSDELKTSLQSNGNYQFFKIGTDKGTSVDSDLNLTLDTIVNELVPQLNGISGTIEAFCARQEEENRNLRC